jgi:hypothetical protein
MFKEANEPRLDKDADERLTDIRLVDALETMARRCLGLQAAVSSLNNGCGDGLAEGVLQLAEDIANEMERLASAFEVEQQLRLSRPEGE